MASKATKEDISLLSQLAAVSRVAAATVGDSGVKAVAEQFELTDLAFECAMLADQFESFARAINAAIVKLDVPGVHK